MNEIIIKSKITKLFETSNGNNITFSMEEIIIYNKNERLKIDKYFVNCNVIVQCIFL